jgi:hypothetical protein
LLACEAGTWPSHTFFIRDADVCFHAQHFVIFLLPRT